MEDLKPITGLAWISDRSGCPSGFNMIATSDGAPGNFAKGFNQKFAVHLCYSTTPESLDQVVTDVVMVNDKVSLPIGYAYISEYIDPKVSVSKKKKLCVKTLPLSSAETVVCEIKLTMKSSKVGAPFVRIGEMSGLTLWCKKVSPTVLKPVPRPRNITTGIRALSLDPGDVAQPTSASFKPNPPPENDPPQTNGRAALADNKIYESSNIYGISAIDGIPFTIHPMFENPVTDPASVLMGSPGMKDLRIKTLTDIENEYNYGFVVERSAAVR